MQKNFARLSPLDLANVLWLQWLENVEPELDQIISNLRQAFVACEKTRQQMDYQTGSISLSAALSLTLLIRNAQPTTVFEIGTFIGKSTLAMALAMDATGIPGQIFTCDGSNDFRVPRLSQTPVRGFPRATSTHALETLRSEGVKLDMLHIDGRLGDRDPELIEQIMVPNAVVAVDDFEGTEKGVSVVSQLFSRPAFARHLLIYPMPAHVREAAGLLGSNSTAVLLPSAVLAFPRQSWR